MQRDELVEVLGAFVDPDRMEDYGPNGLQVEGASEVDKVATAVTASRHVIDAATDWGAQALVVHHGLFWRGSAPAPLTGWLGRRVKQLMIHEVNLIQYHLPLDVHAKIGNNARLLDAIGLQDTHERFGNPPIGFIGRDRKGCTPERLHDRLQAALGSPADNAGRILHHLAGDRDTIHNVGVLTGAGPSYFEAAIAAGCDAYVTGEASEMVTHIARETGVHYFWAGHHATERLGIQALGDWLHTKHGLDVRFFDDENPV